MKRASNRWKTFLGGIAILLCVPATATLAAKSNGVNSDVVKRAVESPVALGEIRYKSGDGRDPFLNPTLRGKKGKPQDQEVPRGLQPPGIAGTYIAEAALLGTAFHDSERVAVFRSYDNRAYFLREGDRLFDGYVKNIGSDFVTFIRETKMTSGKTLAQEITKRLRTP